VENWGMEGRIGLTSLEFFDDNSCLIKLKEDMVIAALYTDLNEC
jgi:hypothetical protein